MLDEPRRGVLQVAADDRLRRVGPAALDGLEQRAVLAGELADRRVAPDELREAEEDLDLELLVRARQAGIPGPDDEGAVEGEIRLDDHALRRTRTEAVVLRERSSALRRAPCARAASMRDAWTSSAVRTS